MYLVLDALHSQTSERCINSSLDIVKTTEQIGKKGDVHSMAVIGIVATPADKRAAAAVDVVEESRIANLICEIVGVVDYDVPLVSVAVV